MYVPVSHSVGRQHKRSAIGGKLGVLEIRALFDERERVRAVLAYHKKAESDVLAQAYVGDSVS